MITRVLHRLGNDDKNTVFWCNASKTMFPYKNIFNKVVEELYCTAVLITGSIRIWSIVIDYEHKTREQYE